MQYGTLFKRDTEGNIRSWHIEREYNRYQTVAGIVGGTQTVSGWTTCTGKNLGKKNETTDEEQCEKEVEALYTKKLEGEYHEQMCDVDKVRFLSPMLAKPYKADKVPLDGTYCQPKLDGVRAIISAKGMFSRRGKPIFGAPHVFEALAPVFEAHPDVIFDGELYNHEYKHDFEKIVSAVKKQKPTAEDLEVSRKVVQFHCYDIPSFKTYPFGVRYAWLTDYLASVVGDVIVPVPTTHLGGGDTAAKEALDECFSSYLGDGYEGQMIRLDQPYDVAKRSSRLLKRKEFIDDEFTVVDIIEGQGNWTGCAKRVTLALPDGRTFGTGIKGSQELNAERLENKASLIGVPATVRFLRYSGEGIPYGGVVHTFHQTEKI